jgi:hypothetical protein
VKFVKPIYEVSFLDWLYARDMDENINRWKKAGSRRTFAAATNPLPTPVILSCGLTVVSPHVLGRLCAPWAMARVNVMGDRTAALTIRLVPFTRPVPIILEPSAGVPEGGRSLGVDEYLNDGCFPRVAAKDCMFVCTRPKSEPISPIPLKVS